MVGGRRPLLPEVLGQPAPVGAESPIWTDIRWCIRLQLSGHHGSVEFVGRCILGFVIKAKHDWRDIWRIQVAMHHNCHIFLVYLWSTVWVNIFTQVKYISVKFFQYIDSLYLHIFTSFGRLILIFNKIALIFLGLPIVFNVCSFKFHQVKSPWLHHQ